VVKRLKHLALEGKTIIASIHQPSSDVFELFDSLYLLSDGKTVYFGPAQQAQEVKKSSTFFINHHH
jgi:ABC-type multidrug transport system ATPase subunit